MISVTETVSLQQNNKNPEAHTTLAGEKKMTVNVFVKKFQED
jgi:hypothetical protein